MCNGYMRTLVHPLDFKNVFKDKKLSTLSLCLCCNLVIVLYTALYLLGNYDS